MLTDDGIVPTGFGPATAVGYDGDGLLAAGDSRVARYTGEWQGIGEVADVQAIDGDRLAAAEGVYALPSLDRLGLVDVADVSGDYAATESGLYRYGGENGEWTEVRSGRHVAVASDGEQVHAAAADGCTSSPTGRGSRVRSPSTSAWRRDPRRRHLRITENGIPRATAAEATADGPGGWRRAHWASPMSSASPSPDRTRPTPAHLSARPPAPHPLRTNGLSPVRRFQADTQAFEATVAEATGERLGRVEYERFPDGEHVVQVPKAVSGERAVVVASTVDSEAYLQQHRSTRRTPTVRRRRRTSSSRPSTPTTTRRSRRSKPVSSRRNGATLFTEPNARPVRR